MSYLTDMFSGFTLSNKHILLVAVLIFTVLGVVAFYSSSQAKSYYNGTNSDIASLTLMPYAVNTTDTKSIMIQNPSSSNSVILSENYNCTCQFSSTVLIFPILQQTGNQSYVTGPNSNILQGNQQALVQITAVWLSGPIGNGITVDISGVTSI